VNPDLSFLSLRGRARTASYERGGIFFRLIFLAAFLGLLFVLYLVRAPALRLAGEFWVVDDGARNSDAIIILSDDDFAASRAAHAAELFRAGWAPRIVASGRMLRPYAGLAELMERDLTDRGVPRDAIVRFPHSASNTREEAQLLERLVAERGWHRVLIVTSNYHTRRSRFIFRRVFPSSVEVRVVPAPDPAYDVSNWWHTRMGRKTFVYEIAAYCLARWELRGSDAGGTSEPVAVPSKP
jgi:uncharacterized SAM-binding protein YcdF (DUF218 family)